MAPEEKARQEIDRLLTAAGWVMQNYRELNLAAARGIALREVPLMSGPCDYLLLVDRVVQFDADRLLLYVHGVLARSAAPVLGRSDRA